MQKLTDVTVLADILVTIFQSERRMFQYMSHVVHDLCRSSTLCNTGGKSKGHIKRG